MSELERAVELLREVRDKGLIYWEPNTSRGYVSKAQMLKRLDDFLSPHSNCGETPPKPDDRRKG